MMGDAYVRAIQHWGVDAQLRKTIEELRELETEVRRALDGKADVNAIISEMSDVYNMLRQLKLIFDIPPRANIIEMDAKMDRTMKRIEEELK